MAQLITHPLPLNTRVVVNRPSCPCANAKIQTVEGTIGKVITNHSGTWYYLGDQGITVRADWVQLVVS